MVIMVEVEVVVVVIVMVVVLVVLEVVEVMLSKESETTPHHYHQISQIRISHPPCASLNGENPACISYTKIPYAQ